MDNSAINRAADEESDESSDDFNDSDGDYEFEAGSKCCSCNTELSSSFLEKCLRRNPIDAGMSKDSDCLQAIGSFISRSDRLPATTPETALDHVCRRRLHRIVGFIGLQIKSMTTEKLLAELLLCWAHLKRLYYKENPQFAAKFRLKNRPAVESDLHGVYQHRSLRKSLFSDLQQGRAASLLEELLGENSWEEWQREGSLTIKGLFN